MSDPKVTAVIDLIKSSNIGNKSWTLQLQQALTDLGFKNNYNYCRSRNIGAENSYSDGYIGKATRTDIIAFLEKYPEALAQLDPKLKQHLTSKGWGGKLSALATAQQKPARQQENSNTSRVVPSRSVPINGPSGETSIPYANAIVAIDNFLAYAEHRDEDVNNHKSYDIRNRHRSYPNGQGATSYTLGQLRYISGSHGHCQINYLTLRDFCNPEKQYCKSLASKLNIQPEDVKNLQFTEANQHLISEVMLEELGFKDFLSGRITRDRLIDRISNKWTSVPGLNGVGKRNGDEYGNHHTISLSKTRTQLDQIRNRYIVDNLTQDLCKINIKLHEHVSVTDGSTILKDPNLVQIFRDHPEAILSLSPQTRALLLNSGLKSQLQNIVADNLDIRKALENEAITLAKGRSLDDLIKDPELLSELQANWALQGTYNAQIDGETGPSTRGAYAQHAQTEKRIEIQRQLDENKPSVFNFWMTPTNPDYAARPPAPFIRQ